MRCNAYFIRTLTYNDTTTDQIFHISLVEFERFHLLSGVDIQSQGGGEGGWRGGAPTEKVGDDRRLAQSKEKPRPD